MRTHNYLTRINDDTWEDMQKIKKMDGRSINSLINEGLRMVRSAKMQELTRGRKESSSLASMRSVDALY